jgi:hypothetical protein
MSLTTEIFPGVPELERLTRTGYAIFMERKPPSAGKAELVMAAVATGSVGSLVGLTVTGILSMLPPWVAVMIVVGELTLPFVVYKLVKRAEQRR